LIERAAERLQKLAEPAQDSKPGAAESIAIDDLARPEPKVPMPERLVDAIPKASDRREPVMDAADRGLHFEVRTEPRAERTDRFDLDLVGLGAQGFLTPEAPATKLAHEFRVIKRPLIANVKGKSAAPVKRANLIMVTSALPSEGKTFTAINLALSIAEELDNTVLLVDGDVAEPSLSRMLGLREARGLIELLTHRELGVSDVLLRTNVPKFTVLPAGEPHRRNTELLASEAMNRLLDEMAARYPDRIIVFDSPPLLATTESRVLATHMGQVVVVVEAQRTTHRQVATAMETLEACPVVMALLNKAAGSDVGTYYGYSYGYGYGT
jgi:exopolysaccharide/PEP-CTERM locus tyrosine autokinase